MELLNELLQSAYTHVMIVSTGIVLLLAAGKMRAGTFTVGDFALFARLVGEVECILNLGQREPMGHERRHVDVAALEQQALRRRLANIADHHPLEGARRPRLIRVDIEKEKFSTN